jgi:hypothetical protein
MKSESLSQTSEGATTTLASRSSRPSIGSLVRRPEMGSFIGLIDVFAFFSIFGGANFLTAGGAASWLNVASELGIIALPVGLLMIAGHLDLSVGSMIPASSSSRPTAPFGSIGTSSAILIRAPMDHRARVIQEIGRALAAPLLPRLGRPLDHLDLANRVTRLLKHFGQKVPDLADGLRACHDMDFVNSLRLPLVDRGAVDGIDEWSQKRVACKDRDSQDHGLRREPYAGQCTYSG